MVIELAVFSLITALVIGLIIGPFLIAGLRYLKFGQSIREDGPKGHFKKAGTPTMGGLIFLIAFLISSIIWGAGSSTMTLIIITVLAFGLIGFIDDSIIIIMKRSLGLTAKQKLVLQFLFALIFIYVAVNIFGRGTEIVFPFGIKLELGFFYYLIISVFMVFMTNAVNLTDGLDGLAGGVSFFVLLGFMVISALANDNILGTAIYYPDLVIASGALAGGILAFLFYNKFPAKIFMGDTGSLALGGAVTALSILTKTEFILIFLGIIYLIEALSVVIQVISFKLTGKRIFKMSPLHHHFEMVGWAETKIVYAFWSVTIIGVIIGLFLTIL